MSHKLNFWVCDFWKTLHVPFVFLHCFYLLPLRFDRKARDMQQKYELRMREIREDMVAGSDVTLPSKRISAGFSQEKKRRGQIQMIEELDA